jgi:hypothetical protein
VAQGRAPDAQPLSEEGVELARSLGDAEGSADALTVLV